MGTADHAGGSGLATILRTSYVRPVGRNFLITMLRLHHPNAAINKPIE